MKQFLFLITLLPFTARSQWLTGIETGMSFNYLYTNISNREFTVIRPGVGFALGIPLQIVFRSWLLAGMEPEVIQKNYLIARTGSLNGVYARHKNTYLQLPLTMSAVYGKRLKVFVSGGFYAGYWLSGSLKGMIPDIFSSNVNIDGGSQQSESFRLVAYHQKYFFDHERDNRIEFGSVVGIGMRYVLNSEYDLFIKCSYYQSLTDQQKKYMVNQIPQYNRTVVFSAGCMIVLK